MDLSYDSGEMELCNSDRAEDESSTAAEQERTREDSEEGILTPLQTDDSLWTATKLVSNLVLQSDNHFVSEIVSSSAELTPIMPDKRVS